MSGQTMTVPGRMVLASGNAPYARSITLWAPDCLRTGDTLAVWKLDRLGRSVKEVLTIADDLYARGVGVKILTGKLSGSYSPHGEGKFFFTMMAAFAELERDIIHERTMAGGAGGLDAGSPPCMAWWLAHGSILRPLRILSYCAPAAAGTRASGCWRPGS